MKQKLTCLLISSSLTRSANTSTAQTSVREVGCQTKLCIPLDLDLEKILSGYLTTTEEVVVAHSNDSRCVCVCVCRHSIENVDCDISIARLAVLMLKDCCLLHNKFIHSFIHSD